MQANHWTILLLTLIIVVYVVVKVRHYMCVRKFAEMNAVFRGGPIFDYTRPQTSD